MPTTRRLLAGVELVALFGAVALIVWNMPEPGDTGRPAYDAVGTVR